jgi:hypothetical protein
VITSTFDTRGLAARLDRLPGQLRAFARNKISYRKGRKGRAKDATASQRLHRLRVRRVPIAPFAITEIQSVSIPEIRAALIAAAREALSR